MKRYTQSTRLGVRSFFLTLLMLFGVVKINAMATLGTSWGSIPGVLKQVCVAKNYLIGVNPSDDIYTIKINGSIQNAVAGNWTQIPGKLSNVAVNSNGQTVGVNSAGNAYYLDLSTANLQSPSWQGIDLNGVTGKLVQVSINDAGQIWAVDNTSPSTNPGGGYIYFRIGATASNPMGTGGWQRVPGGLTWVSIDNNGQVWGVNSNGSIYTVSTTQNFNPSAPAWQGLPGLLTQISASRTGVVGTGIGSGSSQLFYMLQGITQSTPMGNGSWAAFDGWGSNISIDDSNNIVCIGDGGSIWYRTGQPAAALVPSIIAPIAAPVQDSPVVSAVLPPVQVAVPSQVQSIAPTSLVQAQPVVPVAAPVAAPAVIPTQAVAPVVGVQAQPVVPVAAPVVQPVQVTVPVAAQAAQSGTPVAAVQAPTASARVTTKAQPTAKKPASKKAVKATKKAAKKAAKKGKKIATKKTAGQQPVTATAGAVVVDRTAATTDTAATDTTAVDETAIDETGAVV